MTSQQTYYGVKPTDKTAKPIPVTTTPIGEGLTILILCAGMLKIWEAEGHPRHFYPIAGTTVLWHPIEQIRELGHEPIIVTNRDDIKKGTEGLRHFEPEYNRTIAETWLYTRELWTEQTVILLGDVIHGELTIKDVIKYRGTMQMIGNSAEIYDFTFCSSEHDRVAKILYETNRYTLKGSPWEIYRHWCDQPYNRGFKEDKVFRWVKDRTCDIDTPNEYQGALGVWGK